MTSPDAVDAAVAQWRRERPDLDFWAMGPLARLARLSVLGEALVDRVFDDAGVDRAGFNVLAALRRVGSPFRLTPSDLAAAQLTTRGGMTKMIDRLERQGLVERVANAADRRSTLVGLTERGVDLIDRLVTAHVANESALLTGIDRTELATFDRVLRTLLVRAGDVAPSHDA